ncbi:hypothetical protein F5B21DRAFT_247226 [Xylaria acuta]|nr:hypothetical protein F5B21DRAFT_247226 [Xylaria acuta]
MRLTPSVATSLHSMIWRWIRMTTSGTILVSISSHFPPPCFSKTSLSASCEESVDGSLAAVVETMSKATFKGPSAMIRMALRKSEDFRVRIIQMEINRL